MHTKHISNTLKQQCSIFHLARHDPERWEQEKETTLLNSLHDAWEKASAAEREAETNKKLWKNSQQQASIFIVYEDVLRAHGTKNRLTTCRRDSPTLKMHEKLYARPMHQSPVNSQVRMRL